MFNIKTFIIIIIVIVFELLIVFISRFLSKYRVKGGKMIRVYPIEGVCHLGIVSQFFQRDVRADSIKEVKDTLMQEYKDGTLFPCIGKGKNEVRWNGIREKGKFTYCIVDSDGETVLEFTILSH